MRPHFSHVNALCFFIGFIDDVCVSSPKFQAPFKNTGERGYCTYGWLLAAFVGMFPYLLAGTFDTAADAFFESMSGFATVGASVLDDIDGAPYSILMWRSVTHWLGGMGIIVLFVALISNMGAGAMQVFRAEAAGPVKDKLHPKIADSARSLWVIYIFNTCITFVLLLICGMNGFDALTCFLYCGDRWIFYQNQQYRVLPKPFAGMGCSRFYVYGRH